MEAGCANRIKRDSFTSVAEIEPATELSPGHERPSRHRDEGLVETGPGHSRSGTERQRPSDPATTHRAPSP